MQFSTSRFQRPEFAYPNVLFRRDDGLCSLPDRQRGGCFVGGRGAVWMIGAPKEFRRITRAAIIPISALLTDAGGSLMDLSSKKKYSFPAIIGVNPGEPLSTRSARMKIYNELVAQLDSGGGSYSKDLSEVDLTDPEDVKVLANDPEGEVLVHLGSSDYLSRFKIYVAHLREWRQQFTKLDSVDLRYDRQIIVNPDLHGVERQPALSSAMVRAAMSAGVRPTALVNREPVKSQPVVVSRAAAAKPKPNPTSKTRWHKKWTPAKHAAKPAPHAVGPHTAAPRTSAAHGASKSPTTPQKPSPGVVKGQGTQ
jgi:cell division protein FtsQ